MPGRQSPDPPIPKAIRVVFHEYVEEQGFSEPAEIFGKGVKIEVGDMLPSKHYADRLKRVPPLWDKAFEVNASGEPTIRASCVEFILAGLYAMEKISRAQQHGRMVYEVD